VFRRLIYRLFLVAQFLSPSLSRLGDVVVNFDIIAFFLEQLCFCAGAYFYELFLTLEILGGDGRKHNLIQGSVWL
jgi:hypothetical protein